MTLESGGSGSIVNFCASSESMTGFIPSRIGIHFICATPPGPAGYAIILKLHRGKETGEANKLLYVE